MRLETERLLLRDLTEDDWSDLFAILSDPETMRFYPAPFDGDRVRAWIRWNRENEETFGFSLSAVVRKSDGKMIGDCGITMQRIHGKIRPEIGYHIQKSAWGNGYASEAAARCRDFLFEETPFRAAYSYMKYSNTASCRVAEKCGMRLIGEYADPVNTVTRVYRITKKEWAHRGQTEARGRPARCAIGRFAAGGRKRQTGFSMLRTGKQAGERKKGWE